MNAEERDSLDHVLEAFRGPWPKEPAMCHVPITELDRDDLLATLRYMFWFYKNASTPAARSRKLEELGIKPPRVI